MTWKTSRLGVAFVVAFCVACGGGKSDPIPAPDADILLPDGGFAPAIIPNPVLVQTVAPEEVRAGEIIAVSCIIIDDSGEEYSSRGRSPRIRVAPEASVELMGTDIVAAIADVDRPAGRLVAPGLRPTRRRGRSAPTESRRRFRIPAAPAR